jgi:hypothetical protein
MAAALLVVRIAGLHLGARTSLGHLDLNEVQQLLRVLRRPPARDLDDLERRVAAAAARDGDVAGDVAEMNLAARPELQRARRALRLLLAPFAVALTLPLDGDRALARAGQVARRSERVRVDGQRRERGNEDDHSVHLGLPSVAYDLLAPSTTCAAPAASPRRIWFISAIVS